MVVDFDDYTKALVILLVKECAKTNSDCNRYSNISNITTFNIANRALEQLGADTVPPKENA